MTSDAPRPFLTPGRRAALGALILLALGVLTWRFFFTGAGPADAETRARAREQELLREAEQVAPPPTTPEETPPGPPPEPTRGPVPIK